ncbi:MAG: TetR/AcrR family transcriptional regulator [Rubrivivax sp.]|nr:TetR/AcrR family transcriptional regulator [Rubrivivax sp.]MDH5339675.1 TetR/AcrR family transcriptional regulator [Rubrivivax sp.]
MTPAAPPVAPSKARSSRSDGAQTRNHILRVAGPLYAARGYEGTTSREICAAAGINQAAVNYHFGSKDGLYEAVLVEAHGQLVAIGDLEAIAHSGADPEARLAALIGLFITRSNGPALPWALRVLGNELMAAPSGHVDALLQQAVLPKVRVMRGIVASVLGVAATEPVAQRALALVVMPCIMLNLAPRDRLRQVLPALASDPQALVDDMTCYALAGLASIARRHGAPGPQP